jgi:polyisoprenyl-teichoic acid--peptidoglycan teichoic acid transferase
MQNRGRTRVANDKADKAEKKKNSKKIMLIIAAAVLLIVVGAVVYVEMKIATMNQPVDINASAMPTDTEEAAPTNIPEVNDDELTQIQNKVPTDLYSNPKAVNILLLGLDTRNPKQFSGGRTDSIIIVTLDTVNKQIKLTSIMRDTLIKIAGHDMNRINTVFGYNGPEAAMETVQKYFGVKIDYYAVVNFWAVANIIDSVGGVEIDVKQSEIANLNLNLSEINRYNLDKDSTKIKHAGLQKLDGKQATSYMRIRHVGEADFERTERQRRVLEAIAKKDFSLAEVVSLTNGLPDNVRTNMNQLQMAEMAKTALELKGAPIKQTRLPIDGSFKMSRYKGMSILTVDFTKNAEALKNFIINKQ